LSACIQPFAALGGIEFGKNKSLDGIDLWKTRVWMVSSTVSPSVDPSFLAGCPQYLRQLEPKLPAGSDFLAIVSAAKPSRDREGRIDRPIFIGVALREDQRFN
jgi:hypothetical protein